MRACVRAYVYLCMYKLYMYKLRACVRAYFCAYTYYVFVCARVCLSTVCIYTVRPPARLSLLLLWFLTHVLVSFLSLQLSLC